jgi:hypothetical protein
MRTRRWAAVMLGVLLIVGATAGPARAQPDGSSTRMMFGATGHTLPQGKGYIGAYAVMMPFFQVGVTDTITVGAGAPIPAYLFWSDRNGSSYHPFVVTAKARLYHSARTSVAAGAMDLTSGGREHVGFAYVVGTRDSATGSASLGVGCVYVVTRNGPACRPVVTAGGDHRLNRRVSLMTENHVLLGNGAVLSGGVRLSRTRLSTDLGMMVLVGSGLYPGLIVNFAYRLGGS